MWTWSRATAFPSSIAGLPCIEAIRQTEHVDGEYDAVILLECDSIERSGIGGLEGRFTVNIDHHFSGKAFADVNWIENDACAVAAMVYELAMLAGVRITPEMATCLYTAVLTDTGSFCYAGTDARAFEIAADSFATEPIRRSSRSTPTSQTRRRRCAFWRGLSRLYRDGRLAWMSVTQEDMLARLPPKKTAKGL